jgi:hypothetical protein
MLAHNALDAFEDPSGNILTVEVRDGVPFVRPIQPCIRKPIATCGEARGISALR